jgi:MerR family transcriptional regulator, activator of bmr gene
LGKKTFSIGEVSRIKGVTRKALRFYDKIGLLKPYFINPENGYRFYSIEQFVQIDIIRALRAMDVSPIEIRTVLLRKNTGDVMAFLDAQRRNAAGRIEELGRIIDTIDGVQDTIRGSLSSFSRKGVYRKRLERRHVVTLPYRNWSSDDEAVIEFSKFDRIIEGHGFVNGYQTGVLFKPGHNGSVPFLIFNTVRVHGKPDPSAVKTLPAGEYVCICYSRKNAAGQTLKINRYCARTGLSPRLVLQVELLNDVFSTDSTTAELQLLV